MHIVCGIVKIMLLQPNLIVYIVYLSLAHPNLGQRQSTLCAQGIMTQVKTTCIKCLQSKHV